FAEAAEQVAAPDGGGITASRGSTALQPPRQVSLSFGGKNPGVSMAKRARKVKVALRDDDGNIETLWATPLRRHRYRLENSPFFAYGVSWLDVVEAKPPSKGEFPEFVRVTKKSGNRTIRIIFKPQVDKSKKAIAVLERLVSMGCSFEGANPG